MAGMGPPPKNPDQRRRRNVKPGPTRLPASGRKGPAPKWPIPLATAPSPDAQKQLRKLERELWGQLWSTPQAVGWERLGYTREVAQYVRWKILGELGSLDAAKEARQLADRLGLTPLALMRLQWTIDDVDEVAQAREQRKPATRRLRAVDAAVT